MYQILDQIGTVCFPHLLLQSISQFTVWLVVYIKLLHITFIFKIEYHGTILHKKSLSNVGIW